MENVTICNSTAEDALNLVKSSFHIDNLKVQSVSSDGVDADFSDGKIINSMFQNIGGDALDFSGSEVSIANTIFIDVRDKAISAGENSNVVVKGSNFSNIGVGIASKDGSNVDGFKLKIDNYRFKAATSYIKKDFYGTPSLTLNNSTFTRVNSAFLRQRGTILTINSIDIDEEDVDVKQLYKSEIMKKK